MIVYKKWHKGDFFFGKTYIGWFLFGVIPLYIRQLK